jgi:hypothetical protein
MKGLCVYNYGFFTGYWILKGWMSIRPFVTYE